MADGAHDFPADVHVVWKLERLVGDGPPAKEITDGSGDSGTRGREYAGRLAGKYGNLGIAHWGGRCKQAAADTPGKRREAHGHNPGEAYMSAQRLLPAQRAAPSGPRLRR